MTISARRTTSTRSTPWTRRRPPPPLSLQSAVDALPLTQQAAAAWEASSSGAVGQALQLLQAAPQHFPVDTAVAAQVAGALLARRQAWLAESRKVVAHVCQVRVRVRVRACPLPRGRQQGQGLCVRECGWPAGDTEQQQRRSPAALLPGAWSLQHHLRLCSSVVRGVPVPVPVAAHIAGWPCAPCLAPGACLVACVLRLLPCRWRRPCCSSSTRVRASRGLRARRRSPTPLAVTGSCCSGQRCW